MDADDYQNRTELTEIYTPAVERFLDQRQDVQAKWLKLAYCTGKLNGEAGEIAEEIFKAFRDDGGHIEGNRRERLLKELGDEQWYLARIADLLGFDLSTVMETNITKLAKRKENGTLSGSGENR